MPGAARELRILGGVHAGAAAPLGERVLLGASLDCDIVLVDAGIGARHAEIAWDEARGQWTLRPLDGAPAAAYPEGAAVTVGPLRLTVAAANSEWRHTDALTGKPLAAEPPTALPDDGADRAAAQPVTAVAAGTAGNRGRRRGQTTLLLAAFALPAALVAIWAVLRQLGSPAQGDFVAPAGWSGAAPAPVADHAANHAATRAALAALQLDKTLRVETLADGTPRVVGVLADDATVEALGAALLALEPRPAMAVYSESALRQLLQETSAALPRGVRLEWTGQQSLVLSGAVSSAEDRQSVMTSVRAGLPAGLALEERLLLPAQLAEQFLNDARNAGFRLDGRFNDGQLELTGRIAATDLRRWERFLVEFNGRTGGVLPLAARVDASVPVTANPTATAPPSRPPFAIQTMVGGEGGFIVLADGTRLMPGGSRAGWQLEAVTDREVVFMVGERRVAVSR